MYIYQLLGAESGSDLGHSSLIFTPVDITQCTRPVGVVGVAVSLMTHRLYQQSILYMSEP